MKSNVTLIIASLSSILFTSLHVADDIVRGFEPGGPFDLVLVPVLVIWLYGTLMLAERRSGYVIILLGSLVGILALVLHFRATGGVAGGETAKSSGAFFFVWTLIALGVSSLFSVVLSVQAFLRQPPRLPR